MRVNEPVTGVEYVVNDNETIVSKTDLQGNITYANEDFIRISGFTAEELIGAPQNIVRHPDMPPEAFADFWKTLKAGKAWTGMVKNRCKNGDHYWVEANAAPLFEHGRQVGYTSIRLKPSRAQVAAAEEAYRKIREGNADIEIREGAVVRRSLSAGLLARLNLSIRAKVLVSAGLLAALFLSSLLLAAAGDGTANWTAYPSVAGLVLTLVAGYVLHKSAVAPLARIEADIATMSAGDLSARIAVHGDDEIARLGQALRVLQTNVKVIVGQIKEATAVVADGTSEIAAGSADLSARAEAQANALQQTAATMEELTKSVRNNADSAHQADGLISSTSETALKGGEAVNEVVTTMELIKDSSSKIVDIIGVIDGIAFQTNILALNAAVEAARAGEQGRGFAVVASEVRALAQRSASAAKEIKALIADSAERVDAGAKVVDQAGTTMNDIAGQVKQVAAYMNDISTASREQRTGIEQVNRAINEMDEVAQHNAALIEEAAAATATMRQQVANLTRLVAGFKLLSTDSPAGVKQAPAVAHAKQRPGPHPTPIAHGRVV